MIINPDPRHEARKMALSYLFSFNFDDNSQKGIEDIDITQEIKDMTDQELKQNIDFDRDLYNNLCAGVKKHVEQIDLKIANFAPEWPVDKIAKIDLAILRIAFYEILYQNSIPNKVSVDEAVELAKLYGNDTSSKFVNGVLGGLLDNLTKAKEKPKEHTKTQE